ncbi:MAG: 3'(2'),5'-bisphosphate nucleotidase [Isosphaeraceae bacterium]|jgi:3'(2'), 5'-bisphosphate nucleotidase|nr:MAG: 3'(2'),5'-bisphosphate nucleotidase [Isosphaeraceae bacterium]
MSYEIERRVALAAVREASRLCRAVQAEISPEVLAKKDKSPVTVADYGSQALIGRILAEAFPGDPLVAEEDAAELRLAGNEAIRDGVIRQVRAIHPEADVESILRAIDHGTAESRADRFWTLDPIDGTKGFLRKEQYAVALALLVDGRVAVAALACPNLPLRADATDPTGTVFLAVRGEGAFAVPLDDPAAPEVRIQVSDTDDSSRARFCESVESGHSAHGDSERIAQRLAITAEPVRMDSQAKYGVVARGQAELYLRLPTRADYREKIWDHAAGTLVIEEAGGTVTDIDGHPLDFSQGRELRGNRGIVASNGRLHAAALAAIAALGL